MNVEFEGHRPISREEGYEDTRPKNSERHPDRTARKSEEKAFRKELRNDFAARCTQGDAHPQFFPSSSRAHQHQSGDIDAGNQ